MKLSFNWLLDFVEVGDLSAQEVADKLTMGAFEVEEVTRVGASLVGPLKVGEIVEINPHPNADKIRLTKIKIDDQAEPLEIVCGAGNIVVGQRVPVALAGARVVNRHDGTELHIKPTKIRGVQSNGMLCSPPELGITGGESDGILILSGTPALGTDIVDLLELHPDYVLHVGTRSNRGDALCVAGIAREVAALLKRPLKEPQWALPQEDQTSDAVDLKIENLDDCPYFSLRILQGITVGPSPRWLTRRLEAIGVRSVNNVVDATNYVLHELGQPLHAYDLAKLKTRLMEIRRARAGETLTTLDGKTRELTDEVLVIAEAGQVLGVAGVMGGKESEISDDTRFVALEAAAFHPARVRRASRLLGLSSESSLRFERGVDVASVRRASDRAAALILASAGGFAGRITTAGSDITRKLSIELRLSQLERLTDIKAGPDEIGELLKPLSFDSKVTGPGALEVSVPSFRQSDVTREIDVIEEVCRLWGYERVPASMPATTVAPERPPRPERLARQALSACGLNETYTASLVGPEPLGGQAGEAAASTVHVLNPLSEDHQVLRTSLLPGLVRAVAYNQDRGTKDVWLFEVGRVYEKSGGSSDRETGVKEELKVAAVVAGRESLSNWQNEGGDLKNLQSNERPSNFYQAKGVLENLLGRFSIEPTNVRFTHLQEAAELFHPGRSCQVLYAGQKGQTTVLGRLGDLHPAVADRLGLRSATTLFELTLDALMAVATERQFAEIHTTPYVVRDLTADFARTIEHAQVVACITKVAGDNLRALELVSVFTPGESSRSLSYRLTFQNPDQTLTNEEVEKSLAGIRDNLRKELAASFRS